MIIVLCVILLIVGSSVFAWVYFKQKGKLSSDPSVAVLPSVVVDTTVPDVVPPIATTPEPTKVDGDVAIVSTDPSGDSAKQIARIFVEQWGSYSLLHQFSTLDNASLYATPEVRSYLKIKKQQLMASDTPVPQIISDVLGLSIGERSETTMTITVSARRSERLNGSETLYKQKALVKLVKEGDTWLVARAEWNETKF